VKEEKDSSARGERDCRKGKLQNGIKSFQDNMKYVRRRDTDLV
jgi:hypothetical protein